MAMQHLDSVHLHSSAVIWSSIIMMHMPLSSFPLRPALPLIWMYSPLDMLLHVISTLEAAEVMLMSEKRLKFHEGSGKHCPLD